MEIRNIRKEERGPTIGDLSPTYLLSIEIRVSESGAVTNNTERAAKWRAIQDAIAAWEAGQ